MDTFRGAANKEIQNKEIAALMGEVDEENPNVLSGGLISRLGLTDAKLAHIKAKKRNKDFRDWLFRETIRESLKQINEIIKELQKWIEELLEQMAKAEEELVELDEQHEILEAELEYFQEHGLFDCDEHGRLKNPEAEAILSRWEEKTGQKIDRTDPASYEVILQILMEIEQFQKALRDGIKRDAAEYEHRKEQLDKAQQIREDLQSGEAAQIRNGLSAFEDFARDYEQGFEYEGNNGFYTAAESDPLMEGAFDELPETLDVDLSFGFPPIQESFTQAGKDQDIPNDADKTVSTKIKKPLQTTNPKS